MDNAGRIIDLESRLMYQEAGLQDLSDVVVRQQSIIDKLTVDIEFLRQQIRAQAQLDVLPESQEPPPPHY